MPDNTWFTPYKSQGIVYKLSNNAVVKLSFQYPIGDKFFPRYRYWAPIPVALARIEGLAYETARFSPSFLNFEELYIHNDAS